MSRGLGGCVAVGVGPRVWCEGSQARRNVGCAVSLRCGVGCAGGPRVRVGRKGQVTGSFVRCVEATRWPFKGVRGVRFKMTEGLSLKGRCF